MRILADENFPRSIVEVLQRGHDVVWARTDCPGLKDSVLLERAESDARIIFTLDKDFWQIALQRPIPLKRSGVVLFRALPAIPKVLTPLVGLALVAGHTWVGHVSVVTRNSIEMFSTGRRRP
jgi:predicted nuclease of predicted toxin-antitoxin system